jgi:thiol:disulfide interchange protein DsbC
MTDPILPCPANPAMYKGRKTLLIALGLAAAGLATGVMAAPHIVLPKLLMDRAQAAEAHEVTQALKLRLPKTKIDKVDCGLVTGLCEVSAGGILFYVDRTARYLFVGRLYDMETRADLTAARVSMS